MPAKNRFPGLCQYCGAEVTRTTAPAHLRECPTRKTAIKSKANKRQSVYQAEVLYLRAEATDWPEFWLDLEVRGDAQLQDVDDYLPCAPTASDSSSQSTTAKMYCTSLATLSAYSPTVWKKHCAEN